MPLVCNACAVSAVRRIHCISRLALRVAGRYFAEQGTIAGLSQSLTRIGQIPPHSCPWIFRMTTPKEIPVRLGPLPALIFSSRWLQLPLYLGLIVAQGVYVVLFLKQLWHL